MSAVEGTGPEPASELGLERLRQGHSTLAELDMPHISAALEKIDECIQELEARIGEAAAARLDEFVLSSMSVTFNKKQA